MDIRDVQLSLCGYLYINGPCGTEEDNDRRRGGIQMNEGSLLVAAILMETAIAMVLLSRVLKYRANRWANIIVGIIQTAAVSLSLFVSMPPLYYMFFAAIEIPCTLFIVWYAWKWTNPEG
jgi:hypothetical protein